MSIVSLARVPDRVHSVEELLGAVRQFKDVRAVVVIVEDGTGVTCMSVDGTSAERVNWLLDRAKFLIHKAD